MKTFALAAALIFCARLVHAQAVTTTITDQNGNTIVEDIKTNADGLPVATTILSTITTTSSTPGNLGPVGNTSPTTNGPAPPTTYVYTTTYDGVQTLVTTVFTPTYQPTLPNPTPTLRGTILDLSAFNAQFTQPKSGALGRLDPGFEAAIGMTFIGMALGAWGVVAAI